MNERVRRLIADMRLNAPATEEILERVQKQIGIVFPQGYTEFLREANGGQGRVGKSYLMLLPVEEIAHWNDEASVADFAPGLVLFGSAGDDTAFAFDTRVEPAVFVDVPMTGMSLDEVTYRGRTFREFLETLHRCLEW